MNFSNKEKCNFLDGLFKNYEYGVPRSGSTEEKILKILVGTQGTTRLGAYPTEDTIREIKKRIKHNVSINKTLEISSAWGAIKTVSTPNRKVDLAELFAIKQYQAMAERIKTVYEPGLIFNIYLGDSYYKYLYGEDSRINDYCKGMEALGCNNNSIRVIRLNDKCKVIPSAMQECNVNYTILKKYWDETYNIPVEKYNLLSSSKRLHEHGWVGDITPEMRAFYLKRMKMLYPEQGYDYWEDKVIKFFSYGLFISQHDLMGRKNVETSTVDSCLLRVPPPNLPRKLYSNRIRMRITPENIIKNSAPPWTVAGVVSIDKKGKMHAHILSSSEYNELPDDYEFVNYNGIDIIFYEKEF